DGGNKWFIGQPISVYYDYQFGGIWQTADSVQMKRYGRKPGDIRIVDQNNDGKIDASDRVILGTPFPKWIGSLNSRFDWRGFDLSVMALARWGLTMDDAFRRDRTALAGRTNNVAVITWRRTNPRIPHQRRNAQLLDGDDGRDRRPLTVGGTMHKRTVGLFAAVLATCLPACVDLNEDVVTGLTPGAYGSEGVFQALVNASYEPLR